MSQSISKPSSKLSTLSSLVFLAAIPYTAKAEVVSKPSSPLLNDYSALHAPTPQFTSSSFSLQSNERINTPSATIGALIPNLPASPPYRGAQIGPSQIDMRDLRFSADSSSSYGSRWKFIALSLGSVYAFFATLRAWRKFNYWYLSLANDVHDIVRDRASGKRPWNTKSFADRFVVSHADEKYETHRIRLPRYRETIELVRKSDNQSK